MSENNIVILDDHPLYLIGLKRIINDESDFRVTDCCKNSSELFLSLSLAPANIAIIDCSLPNGDLDVKAVIDKLHRHYPKMAIVTMGDCRHHQMQSDALQPLVKSYFCKSLSPENVITGLRHIWLNHRYDEKGISADGEKDKIGARLSAKEKIVMEYLHAGLSVSKTALRLSRSVKTISSQKRAAMRKLGLHRDSDIFRLDINDV